MHVSDDISAVFFAVEIPRRHRLQHLLLGMLCVCVVNAVEKMWSWCVATVAPDSSFSVRTCVYASALELKSVLTIPVQVTRQCYSHRISVILDKQIN